MPTIKELKEDLQFNTELIDLLDVMKNTAIFQFHSLLAKKERFGIFFESVKGFFDLIGKTRSENVLVNPKSDKEAIIMVTSDEGFMGSLNSQVIGLASIQDGFKDANLIIIGERGAHQLEEIKRTFMPFRGATDAASRRALAWALADYIIRGARKGLFGRVRVAYPMPISFMYQKAKIVNILPLTEMKPEKEDEKVQELIVESPLNDIIDYLAEGLIRQKLIGILEDSKLSEFAARAIHLESSSQELTDKKKKVKSQYFRAYHEMIDKSTRELFSAQIIIRGKGG